MNISFTLTYLDHNLHIELFILDAFDVDFEGLASGFEFEPRCGVLDVDDEAESGEIVFLAHL